MKRFTKEQRERLEKDFKINTKDLSDKKLIEIVLSKWMKKNMRKIFLDETKRIIEIFEKNKYK